MDHHQHNGNIKCVFPYPDGNEKGSGINTLPLEKITDDEGHIKNISIEIDSKANELGIASSEDNVNQAALEDGNNDAVDEYVHSLWKWPTGRSCFTKASNIQP